MKCSKLMSRPANVSLILTFLAILWLPTCDSLWELDRCASPNENRTLSGFPKKFTSAGSYLTDFGRFFEDHFGFRNQLVFWNSHWKRKLFNESPLSMTMLAWIFA